MTANQATQEQPTPNAAEEKPKGRTASDRNKGLTTGQATEIFKNSILSAAPSESDQAADNDDKAGQNKGKPKSGQSPKDDPNDEDTQNDEEADDGQSEGEEGEVEDGIDDEGEGDDTNDDDSDEELHTVIVNGKEVHVTYDELINGYSRMADYNRKTVEIAQERKQLQAEKEQIADLPKVKEAYQTQVNRFTQNAQLILTAFDNGFLPPEPPAELREAEPGKYLAMKEKREEAVKFYGSLKGELNKITEQQKAELAQAVTNGRAELMKAEPELQKPEIRSRLQNYVFGLGYTEEQVKSEPDHRLFQLAYKAMKYDDMLARAKRPAPEKKRPKVMKQSGAPESKETIRVKKQSETMARHRTVGSVHSASDVLAQKILNASKRK